MKRIFALCLALLLVLSGCVGPVEPGKPVGPQETEPAEELEVHFLDVGQADCIFLRCGGETMLIDGGNVADSSLVVSYLLDQGVEELDWVVSTHPHEDHAGGLAGVLAVFPVHQVYATTTTYASQCYDDFLRYVDQQELTAEKPAPGETWMLGDCRVTCLGPVKSYADTNNTSIVLRADFGETSFLFTGDMEQEAEADLLASGADVRADVLKVGHHGSSTSTSEDFLRQVDPDYAVISCGAGNSYGHPHQETLAKLWAAGVVEYRTDVAGAIVAVSDGSTITFRDADGVPPVTTAAEPEESRYIGNLNSHKFHLPTCSGLPAEENQVIFDSYEQAVEAGYTPCQRCLG